jgi:hypothetical protein
MGVVLSSHQKSTVVANACLYDIHVKCEGDKNFKSREMTEKYTVEAYNVVVGYTKHKVNEPSAEFALGYIKIPSGYTQEFHPECSKKAYLTILHPDENNCWKQICCMHAIPENQNVIIEHTGSVKLTKGKDSYWVDDEGCDHRECIEKLEEYRKKVKEMKDKFQRELSRVRADYKMPRSTAV